MQRYKCHKEVKAVKIHFIDLNHENSGAFISPEDPGMDRIEVSAEWLNKHQPQAGGYFVRYDDGYTSYSPAEAFEGGYTLISGDAAEPENRTYTPSPIDGYRSLTQEEIDLINETKAKGEEVGLLVDRLFNTTVKKDGYPVSMDQR
jgi:hypothetical protein